MPNYVNQFLNPATPGRTATNTLMGYEQLMQGRERNVIAMDRNEIAARSNKLAGRRLSMEEEKFAIEKLQVPYKFMQMKSRHIASMAKNIANLPAEKQSSEYAKLYNQIIPAPIAQHPEFGPLGVVKNEHYLSPEEFLNLDDKKKAAYLQGMYMSAEQVGALDLTTKKGILEAQKIAAQAKNNMDKLLFEDELKTGQKITQAAIDEQAAQRKQERAIELEKVKGEEDRKTEGVKNKGKGTDKTQTRIDKLRGKIFDVEKEILKIQQGETDKLDVLMAYMAPGYKPKTTGDAEKDKARAIEAAEKYIKWMRKELRRIEKTGAGDDPMGILGK